jgi:orotate phosphoribosyltransferase
MVASLDACKREIGIVIFNAGVVHFGEFFWHAHRTHPEWQLPLAPMFIDLGKLPQELVTEIGACLCAQAAQEDIGFEGVAGVPTGGNGFAEAFCMSARGNASQLLTLQKTDKIHGPVEGFLEWRSLVLQIEDVITTGTSTLDATEVLGVAGCTMHDVIAVIDYELGAAERLKAKGLTLHRIFPISKLLGLWLEEKIITTEQYDKVMASLDAMRTKLMQNS